MAPVIEKGSKLGVHTSVFPRQAIPIVREAAARGVTVPLVKAVENAGVAVDVKKYSPSTFTVTRFLTRWDSAEGIAQPGFPMRQAAQEIVEQIFQRTNEAERAAADWFEVLNEADPPGVLGWTNFGHFLTAVVEEAGRRGVRVALPAFNFGTPEWSEMVALAETGVFARMRDGGHLLTIHEGVPPQSSWPVDAGFGGTIPGAPAVAGAGTHCFRYRFLYHLLQQRGEVVPLVVSEFYAGGGYADRQAPEKVVQRFEWYDAGVRQDPYVLAFLPFTIDPTGDWAGQDYTYAYAHVLDYWARVKDQPNTVQPPVPGRPPVPRRVRVRPNLAGKWNVRTGPGTAFPQCSAASEGTVFPVLAAEWGKTAGVTEPWYLVVPAGYPPAKTPAGWIARSATVEEA